MGTEAARGSSTSSDKVDGGFAVLIIEDTPRTVSTLMSVLRLVGCTVHLKSREQAEDFACVREEHLHAILVDLKLDDEHLGGLEVAKSMKLWYPYTPIVIITAFAGDLGNHLRSILVDGKASLPWVVSSALSKDMLGSKEQIEYWFWNELYKESRRSCGSIVETWTGYVAAVDGDETRLVLRRGVCSQSVILDTERAKSLRIKRQGQPVEMTVWRTSNEESPAARVKFRRLASIEQESRALLEIPQSTQGHAPQKECEY